MQRILEHSNRRTDFVDITTIQQPHTYGTFCDLHLKANHDSFKWAFKQAFEAAAGVSYQNDGPFESAMIHKLRQFSRRGIHIAPNDFEQFSPRAVLAMLKHRWTIEHFKTDELFQAALSSFGVLSFVANSRSKELSKPRRESLDFPVLLQIVDELTKMGHFLYPFYDIQYSEETARKVARDQVVMITKGAGIREIDVIESQTQFLRKLGIDTECTDKSRNGDLRIIAEILHLTYSEDQRLRIICTMWERTSRWKMALHEALCKAAHNDYCQWEEGINPIIAGFL